MFVLYFCLGIRFHWSPLRIPDVQVLPLQLRRRVGHLPRVLLPPGRPETLRKFFDRNRTNFVRKRRFGIDFRTNFGESFGVFGSGLRTGGDDPGWGEVGHPEEQACHKTHWKDRTKEQKSGRTIFMFFWLRYKDLSYC